MSNRTVILACSRCFLSYSQSWWTQANDIKSTWNTKIISAEDACIDGTFAKGASIWIILIDNLFWVCVELFGTGY